MPPNHPAPIIKAIALATLVIGTLDIANTALFYSLNGIPAIHIPQSIASGINGLAASIFVIAIPTAFAASRFLAFRAENQ